MDTAIYAVQRSIVPVAAPVVPSANHARQPVDPPPGEEQYIPSFFCRALYDYQTNDASSLSFHKNDIIEVLTRLESGWWDGLLGEERGWFPSNYVATISDQEAEAALTPSEYEVPQSSLPDDSVVDMADSMSRALSQSDRDGDWLERDADFSVSSHQTNGHAKSSGSTQHHDFWVPQVAPDGRIFYVNTQTGQRAQYLPREAEEDTDSELMGALRQSGSRGGPKAMDGMAQAGFGLNGRSGTPEPWARRLADDGMSYYYVNQLTNTVSWTLPTSDTPSTSNSERQIRALPSTSSFSDGRHGSTTSTRMRSDSSISGARERSYSTTDHQSVYSDDSDVQPRQRNRAESSSSVMKPSNGSYRSGNLAQTIPEQSMIGDLTPAEQVAKVLQRTLAPPPPESPMELSEHVRDAIANIVEFLQISNPARRPDHSREVNDRVLGVVATVRDLLYVTATPSGHIPSHLYLRDDGKSASSSQALQTHLKAAHRKVAGTLSKLVLSALAMQYDPALSMSDKPNRMESDAAELERSVVAFVAEFQRFQKDRPTKAQHAEVKRLYAAFSTRHIGTGLPGAGIAGDWTGFGYTALMPNQELPRRVLDAQIVAEVKDGAAIIEQLLDNLRKSWNRADISHDQLQSEGRNAVTHLSAFLISICDINVAQHVDIDAVRAGSSQSSSHPQYLQTVEKARVLLRSLELATQGLYDDVASLFMVLQSSPPFTPYPSQDMMSFFSDLEIVDAGIATNVDLIVTSLSHLLAVGQDQGDIEQSAYNDAREWRRSRASVFFDGVDVSVPNQFQKEEDVVDMELAFSRPGFRPMNSLDSTRTSSTMYHNGSQHHSQISLDMSDRSRSEGVGEPLTPTWPPPHEASDAGTIVSPISPELEVEGPEDEAATFPDDEGPSHSKSPPRAAKLFKLLGNDAPQHYINKVNADSQPWYLRPNYDQSEILIDPDGGVRAGSKQALIERLTAHETADPTFSKNFMITFKSFMTLDELFELLVQRFWVERPENLTLEELDTWTKQKQVMIRLRVLNTFRTMITDEDVLEKDDMYILDQIKNFASDPEVSNSVAAAKQLVVLIDRVQRAGEAPIRTTNTVPVAPPPPIVPKASKKLKLLDIDPLELARQLTLMEATMYKKIRPIECLTRSREQRTGKSTDNIASIIQLSNRIANWVAESVLSKEDSRKRATVVKHFIAVADRCRLLQNFSTMVAITSGLNTPPIRRLKRTWEQVNQRFMAQLSICESTIDSNKNFNNYRSILASITPPCVPFIGTYLTTLTFINDGAEDKVAGHMINFRKRQKAAEVIQDIKRWQAMPYSFQSVGTILVFLEESFTKYTDGIDYGDQFWHLSLEREPREREDEKMARLLQESGFL